MSATQPQRDWIYLKADELSQRVYGRKFDELDEVRQERVLGTARREYRDYQEPEPGFCFQCGVKLDREDSSECRKCHDPIDSPGRYYFNGRWELII
jgi:hypothetical protein